MPEQLSLKQLRQYTFATRERMNKKRSGYQLDKEPTEFTAFYHRNGGVNHPVLIQDVDEIIEEMTWSSLLDEGFERVAYLREEDTDSTITVGENEGGKIYELTKEPEPRTVDQVQIQLRQE